jgi:hypothetical protein
MDEHGVVRVVVVVAPLTGEPRIDDGEPGRGGVVLVSARRTELP